MKYKELQELSTRDLEAKREEVRLALMKEHAQVASGTAKNPGIISAHRRTIARINTALNTRKEERNE